MTLTTQRVERLLFAAHEGEPDAMAKLRAWCEENPDEADRMARRSWKMQEFMLLQGID